MYYFIFSCIGDIVYLFLKIFLTFSQDKINLKK